MWLLLAQLIAVTVAPVVVAPATATVRVQVTADALNEYVVIVCESAGNYASTVKPLRADTASLSAVFALPVGRYLVTAALYRTQPDQTVGEASRVSETVTVTAVREKDKK